MASKVKGEPALLIPAAGILGAIAYAAYSLIMRRTSKRKIFNMPKVRMPHMKMPKISMPSMKMPKISLPKLHLHLMKK